MTDRGRAHSTPMAVLITGANGYLATQIIVDLLTGSPGARVACLVRSQSVDLASRKLFAALDAAAAHSGQAALDMGARARISVVLGTSTI